MKLLKNIIILLALSLPLLGTLWVVPAYAAAGGAAPASTTPTKSQADACAGLDALDSAHGCGTGGSGVQGIVKAVVNILSLIVGFVSVLMIVVSGLKYITSAGDSNKVASAKNTLIYSIVGLVVVVLAQTMVHFVLTSTPH